MNEKFRIPQADRLVGKNEFDDDAFLDRYNFSQLSKNGDDTLKAEEVLGKVFREKAGELKAFELEKTEREIQIIQDAISAITEFASQYGRNDFKEISFDHIHILELGGVSKITNGALEIGGHSTIRGDVLVERGSDLETALIIFHELWHNLASYSAIQVTTLGKIDTYRSGLTSVSRDGGSESFYSFDEGLVGIATKRFLDEKLRNNRLYTEEIASIESKGRRIDASREEESVFVRTIAREIQKASGDSFKNEDEVISVFFRAQVTGNILAIARIVEDTFGKGSFRKIGENF